MAMMSSRNTFASWFSTSKFSPVCEQKKRWICLPRLKEDRAKKQSSLAEKHKKRMRNEYIIERECSTLVLCNSCHDLLLLVVYV